MPPEALIDRQIAGEPVVAHLGSRVGHGVGLLVVEGLDESLCSVVSPVRVGPSPNVPEAHDSAGLGERLGGIAGGVLAHHLPAIDT